jgi:hypothetical protein
VDAHVGGLLSPIFFGSSGAPIRSALPRSTVICRGSCRMVRPPLRRATLIP